MTYFLLILLPFSLFAGVLDPTHEELHPESEEILLKKPEKYLRHESMIYNLNTELGIKDQRQYTGEDRNRFSFTGQVSANYEHVNNVLGADVTYMRRTERYDQLWWGFQVFQHRTYFDAITQNHTKGSDPNSESNFQRPGNVKNTVLAGGLGLGYRFKLLLDFFETENTFESVDVFVNYVELDETFIKQKYKGYGLTTNYGLHKRAGTSFFYGGKLSYNLASVTRPALGEEKKSERSFALGWLSLGFEMGFFF
jgi:hypothetical protein